MKLSAAIYIVVAVLTTESPANPIIHNEHVANGAAADAIMIKRNNLLDSAQDGGPVIHSSVPALHPTTSTTSTTPSQTCTEAADGQIQCNSVTPTLESKRHEPTKRSLHATTQSAVSGTISEDHIPSQTCTEAADGQIQCNDVTPTLEEAKRHEPTRFALTQLFALAWSITHNLPQHTPVPYIVTPPHPRTRTTCWNVWMKPSYSFCHPTTVTDSPNYERALSTPMPMPTAEVEKRDGGEEEMVTVLIPVPVSPTTLVTEVRRGEDKKVTTVYVHVPIGE